MLLILTLLFGKGLQLLFFGQLRVLELEHLYERGFYALTESFLVLTVFKDEFKMQFLVFFSTLLFLRVFHWIISDRVDLIFQTARPASWLTHARLASAIVLFDLADILLVRYCVMHVLANGTGTLIMFAFEFFLLKNRMMLAASRYILNVIEAFYLSYHEDEDNWESKSFWTFVVETTLDTTRLLTYVAFFFVILKPYGLPPLHIVRDVYVTVMSLFTKVNDFFKARRAQAAMDLEILNATEEDLSRDNVCIICREEMSVGNPQSHRYVPKKLPCRHVIHYGCLKSWLERSQRCPTCRRPVIERERVVVNPLNETRQDFPQNPILAATAAAAGAAAAAAAAAARPNDDNQGQPQDVQIPDFFQPAPQDQDAGADAGAGAAAGAAPRTPMFQFNFNPNQPPRNLAPTPTQPGHGTPANRTQDMILQHHVEFPTGLQLPKGWGVLSAKDAGGIRQVQLTPGNWAVVLPTPSRSSQETDNQADQE